MKTRIKTALMKKMLTARKQKNPFHEKLAELYSLPDTAPDSFNNSYYFSGHDQNGDGFYLRLGLRGDGSCEVWCTYKTGDTVYVNPQMEYKKAEDAPLTVSCVETSKVWTAAYHGPMVDRDHPETALHGIFTGTFTATDPIFDFTYHMDSTSTAVAMAREKWSKEFFQEMSENSQTHYEQNGHMTGSFQIGDKTFPINMNTVRDHSFGKRDWNYMNRHIWLMGVLENGDMVNISMVSYPTMHRLDAGNVIFGGKTISVTAIDFREDMICGGEGPAHFHLTCKLANGRTLTVYGKKDTEVVYIMGGGYTLREGIGSLVVDGRKARGILEFGFNQDPSRW